MVSGGGAAAVYAAQDSLPGEALYPLKTLSEEIRMNLSSSEETRLQLNLQYAERRIAELAEVAGEDDGLAARTMLRLQEHLNQALAATGKVSQDEAIPAMERVRQTLQQQQRLMEQLLVNSDPVHEQAMLHNRQMLTEQLRVVENGLLEDQLQLQNQLMNGQRVKMASRAAPGRDKLRPASRARGCSRDQNSPRILACWRTRCRTRSISRTWGSR